METLELPFGASWLLVPGTKAAWGARFIYPDGMVHDRQGTAGDDTLVQKTLDWLNSKVDLLHGKAPVTDTVIGHVRWITRSRSERGAMTPSDGHGHVFYLDGQGGVIGTPNKSYGYLYVAAYLYEAIPGGCTPAQDGTSIAREYGRE